MDDAPMSLRERKKVETRTRIADVAAGLFVAQGFHAVTVEEVARAAGVSKQTVFNYFPQKEDLVFDRAAEIERSILAALAERSADTTAVDAFRAFTRAMWERIATLSPDRPQSGFFQLLHDTPALRTYGREVTARGLEALTRAIAEEAGADAGDLRPRALAAALMGAHSAVFDAALPRIAGGEVPARFVPALLDRADEAYDLVANGFGGYPKVGTPRRRASSRGPETPSGDRPTRAT
jgi:AcrR family transcriptional regulator